MTDASTRFLERVGGKLPIIQAPMAGAADSPELAASVSEAGGLGSLGCAYMSPEQLGDVAARVRERTQRPFAINLFVREPEIESLDAAAGAAPLLAGFRRELGLPEEVHAVTPTSSYEAQLAKVIELGPRVFSFTFGAARQSDIRRLQAADILVVGTATSLDEAEALAALDVDAICAQGSEAGGHRGTFLGSIDEALIGTMALTRQLVERVARPIIAAGGIMDGAGIRAALALGATAVQLGTAFLLCPEAGTHPAHRAALRSSMARHTVITRAFSGRAARGLRNRMTDAFQRAEPAPFPRQQALTAELRATAATKGRTDLMQLWAGQGAPLLREMAAADLLRTLAREAGLT